MRYRHIDTLKAIGIFFVFLSHHKLTGNSIEQYAFSFHIPLFFIISGMFFKPSYASWNFSDFLKLKLRTRLLPYIFFGAITYPLWLAKHFLRLGGEQNWLTHPIKPVIGMLYGNGVDNWLIHNILLWFLACLFVTEILFYLVLKAGGSRNRIMAIASALLIAGYVNSFFEHARLPFGLDVSLVAVFFLATGYLFKDRLLSFNPGFFVLLLLGAASLVSSSLNGRVDMNFNTYNNMLLFLASSFSGALFYLGISRKLPPLKPVEYVGMNSLLIFPLQVVVFSLITLAYRTLHISMDKQNIFHAIALVIVALLITLPISYLLRKHASRVIGLSS